MPIPFLNAIDLNRNEIQNVRVQNLATSPTHAAGLIYYDTATGLLGVSNGTAWTYLAVGSLDTEAVQDVVGAMGAGSSVVTATYNDVTGVVVYTIGAGQVVDSMVSGTAAISADKTADGTANKVFLAAEKTKLTGIAAGATVNATDAALRDRLTHTGTQSADTLTDGTANKLFLAAEKTKLTGIAAGATANATDLALRDRTTHTGTQSADTTVDGTANKVFLAAEKTKLTGIAAGATANSTDLALRDRTTHTGTQASTTISDFNAAVNALIANVVGAAPATLDTLNELAAALGNDANFATTMTNSLALKANTSSLASVATVGTYASLTSKPTFSATVGDAVATAYVITHAHNTRNVSVVLYQTATPFREVATQIDHTSTTTTTLTFGVAPTAGQYTVYISAV